MAIHDITTEDDLERVLDSHETAVIDFWAPWCPPCKEFAPLFEEAAREHPTMAFCRVNTEEEEALAEAFDVESIPTLVVIRDRIMLASQPGYLPREKLDDLLAQVESLDMDALRREMAEEGGESSP